MIYLLLLALVIAIPPVAEFIIYLQQEEPVPLSWYEYCMEYIYNIAKYISNFDWNPDWDLDKRLKIGWKNNIYALYELIMTNEALVDVTVYYCLFSLVVLYIVDAYHKAMRDKKKLDDLLQFLEHNILSDEDLDILNSDFESLLCHTEQLALKSNWLANLVNNAERINEDLRRSLRFLSDEIPSNE